MNPEQLWLQLERSPADLILGADDAAIAQEWQRYFRRNRALQQTILGNLQPDDYLDCLLDDGFDVDDYLEATDQALSDWL
jgi:hypothetical protein